jgi:hypothetical protein
MISWVGFECMTDKKERFWGLYASPQRCWESQRLSAETLYEHLR